MVAWKEALEKEIGVGGEAVAEFAEGEGGRGGPEVGNAVEGTVVGVEGINDGSFEEGISWGGGREGVDIGHFERE